MPLLARTSAEAHVYLAMTPCAGCGEVGYAPPSTGLVAVDGLPHSRYAGSCPACGSPVEFTFRVPLDPLLPDRDEPCFGADEPSELLDAGQWLWYAERVTDGLPAEPTADMAAPDRQQARRDLLRAAAALTEAIKFVPAGTETVPPEALWSDLGRAVFEQSPGRFHQRRLDAVRRTYQDLADQFR